MTPLRRKEIIVKITGLNHITINVTDLSASKAFYGAVLGLEEAGFIDMGDHRLTYYALPQGVRLELIEYDAPDPVLETSVFHRGIYRHLCLETDDLEGLARRCKEHGITITKEPGYVEKLGCSNILLIDPNGVEVEVIQ